MGVKQHLMGLKKIGPDQKRAAVRQLDMGNLKLGALAAEERKIIAPVKLKRLPRAESQGNESTAARRLLLSLPIRPPVTREGRDPAVGPGDAQRHQVAMQLLQRSPLLRGSAPSDFSQPPSFSAQG